MSEGVCIWEKTLGKESGDMCQGILKVIVDQAITKSSLAR